MSQLRAGLGLDDDEQIDIEELSNLSTQTSSNQENKQKIKNALDKAGEETGFVSRSIRIRRTPYTEQLGGKCRIGMKPLIKKLADRLELFETETIELAILALIKERGYKDLENEFTKITK